MSLDLQIHPATPSRWGDVAGLFGPNGAYSNCWCVWWILTNKDFEEASADRRRELLARRVAGGEEPGLLAYQGDDPVGWVAVGPRERYARMTNPRARVFRPLDGEASWVINCFFVAREWRKRGVAERLLQAAVEFAFSRGANRIDAYPLDPEAQSTSAATLFVGNLGMFLDAGFEEIARIGKRPVVRLVRPAA